MAISELQPWGSCKAVPGRCYNRPVPVRSALPLKLPLLLLLLAATSLTSCLALPSESTTLPTVDIEEAITVNPPQQQQPAIDAISTPTQTAPLNDTIPVEPLETVAAETADEFVQTSFVSLGGEGLEQGIRNAVKSEVESEIEADSSALVDTLQAEQNKQTDATQGVREPKTLEAEAVEAEEESQPEPQPESQPEPQAEAEKEPQVEAEEKPQAEAEAVPQPEAEPDANAEEKGETEIESTTLPPSEELSESHQRPLPSVTSDLVAVILDENRAITEQPLMKTNLLALEQEHEEILLEETTPRPIYEVTKHQVTKKQGVEDLLPVELPKEDTEKQVESEPESQPEAIPEQEPVPESALVPEQEILQAPELQPIVNLEPAAESTSEPSANLNEIEQNSIESDENDKERQAVASSTSEPEPEPEHVESTEASDSVVAQPQGESEADAVEASEPVPAASPETPAEPLTPTERSPEQAEIAEVKPEIEEEQKQSIDLSESSSTAAPAKSEESIEDDVGAESDESANRTEQPSAEPVEKDSSENSSEDLSQDEPKARADDSTATPLVSYPPHNAGQTFDSNLADERSAYLSLSSSNRSTLIIALCSGTAVIFIIISLVIFVLSFQRQHGTLDIEMQEQRLGKDNLDEEDAQMKLLDVDLSPPVIVSMGNEETDECL